MLKFIGCGPRARMGAGYLHHRSRPVLAWSSGSSDFLVPVASPHRASPKPQILLGWCTCSERKTRHKMLCVGHGRFRKGYGYHQWLYSLVQCDFRNRIHQVRQRLVARARRRWLQQPVHRVVTYKTIQGRQLCMTQATATCVFQSMDAAARRTTEL